MRDLDKLFKHYIKHRYNLNESTSISRVRQIVDKVVEDVERAGYDVWDTLLKSIVMESRNNHTLAFVKWSYNDIDGITGDLHIQRSLLNLPEHKLRYVIFHEVIHTTLDQIERAIKNYKQGKKRVNHHDYSFKNIMRDIIRYYDGEVDENGYPLYVEEWSGNSTVADDFRQEQISIYSDNSYFIKCIDCGKVYTYAKLTKDTLYPELYKCGYCGGSLEVDTEQTSPRLLKRREEALGKYYYFCCPLCGSQFSPLTLKASSPSDAIKKCRRTCSRDHHHVVVDRKRVSDKSLRDLSRHCDRNGLEFYDYVSE